MRVQLLLFHLTLAILLTDAFLVQPGCKHMVAERRVASAFTKSTLLYADDSEGKNRPSVSQLGFSEEEVKRSRRSKSEDVKVNVNLVEDVDPLSLTAVGFALIAFNFFVFANMGDGGLGGLVAQIINLSNQ